MLMLSGGKPRSAEHLSSTVDLIPAQFRKRRLTRDMATATLWLWAMATSPGESYCEITRTGAQKRFTKPALAGYRQKISSRQTGAFWNEEGTVYPRFRLFVGVRRNAHFVP